MRKIEKSIRLEKTNWFSWVNWCKLLFKKLFKYTVYRSESSLIDQFWFENIQLWFYRSIRNVRLDFNILAMNSIWFWRQPPEASCSSSITIWSYLYFILHHLHSSHCIHLLFWVHPLTFCFSGSFQYVDLQVVGW